MRIKVNDTYFPNINNTYNNNQDSREGGDIGLFILLVPKVFNNIFLFVGSTTLGTFVEI